MVQKIWAPLRKVFAPPSDPSWLRAWLSVSARLYVPCSSAQQRQHRQV